MNQFNQSLIYKMHSLIYNVDSAFEVMLSKDASINYTEFLILLALEENINYTQEEIAYWSNFTKSTVSKTIDKLVVRKYLKRKDHPTDRRQKVMSFTPLGISELAIAQKLATQLSEHLFEGLSSTEFKSINFIIDKINKDGVTKMLKNI